MHNRVPTDFKRFVVLNNEESVRRVFGCVTTERLPSAFAPHTGLYNAANALDAIV